MVKFPCCLLICHRRNAFCNRENRFVDGWGKEFSDGISFTIIRFGNSIRVEFTWRKSNYLMFLHSIRGGKSSKNFSNETINEEIKSGLIRCDFSSFSGDFSSFTRVFILFFFSFSGIKFSYFLCVFTSSPSLSISQTWTEALNNFNEIQFCYCSAFTFLIKAIICRNRQLMAQNRILFDTIFESTIKYHKWSLN